MLCCIVCIHTCVRVGVCIGVGGWVIGRNRVDSWAEFVAGCH